MSEPDLRRPEDIWSSRLIDRTAYNPHVNEEQQERINDQARHTPSPFRKRRRSLLRPYSKLAVILLLPAPALLINHYASRHEVWRELPAAFRSACRRKDVEVWPQHAGFVMTAD